MCYNLEVPKINYNFVADFVISMMNKEIILRLYVLLLLIGLPLIICAQQRQVKVSLMKGTVLEGNLVEFKAFDHLVMEVKGQRVFIDYKDMAYIDDISQAKEDQQQDLAPVEAVVAVEAVKPAEPVEVVEAVKPVEPVEAVKPVEPVEAVKPVEPVEPVEVVEAIKPAEPVEVVEAIKPAEPVEAVKEKRFLLERGNNVFLECISNPENEAYNEAARDVLQRQMSSDGFWNITDQREEADFFIVCRANLEGRNDATIAIRSLLTGKESALGEIKKYEDVDDYRRVVWELYNKYIIPLHKAIENNKVSKRLKQDFTY
jgi:hypothetical protein